MAPEDAVNLFTHLEGNHLFLNVRDDIHCFYNLYVPAGWILEEPPSFPSPPKLSCRERFQPGEGSAAQTQETEWEGTHRDPTELFQNAGKCSSHGKKHLGMWNSSGCNSARFTWCLSMNMEQPLFFIKGLNSFAFLQDRSLFSGALLKGGWHMGSSQPIIICSCSCLQSQWQTQQQPQFQLPV